jgi:hypothetical protein
MNGRRPHKTSGYEHSNSISPPKSQQDFSTPQRHKTPPTRALSSRKNGSYNASYQASSTTSSIRTIAMPRSISLEVEDSEAVPVIVVDDEYDLEEESFGRIDFSENDSGRMSFISEHFDKSDEYTYSSESSSCSVSPDTVPIASIMYDKEYDLPLWKNPTSGQTVMFLATAKNLPKGYEDAFTPFNINSFSL